MEILPRLFSFKMQNWEQRIVVTSIYMPIEDQLPTNMLERILERSFCRDEKLLPIVVCDTNEHHPLWGGNDINHRGQLLSEFLAITDLEIANLGNEQTFCVGNIQSIIDVTLVSRSLPCDICCWHVSCDNSMSDHRMIRFAVKRDKPAPIWCRNVKHTDWQLYDDELKKSISLWFDLVETPADIERELKVLNTAVIKAFHKACPECHVSGRNKVSWWNQELILLRREANRAFHNSGDARVLIFMKFVTRLVKSKVFYKLSLITIRETTIGRWPSDPTPLGVPRGQIKVKFKFYQIPVKFGIKFIRKLNWIKMWPLLLLNVVRHYKNWKVPLRSDPSGVWRFLWVKGQIPIFFHKPVKFGIKLIRKLCWITISYLLLLCLSGVNRVIEIRRWPSASTAGVPMGQIQVKFQFF